MCKLSSHWLNVIFDHVATEFTWNNYNHSWVNVYSLHYNTGRSGGRVPNCETNENTLHPMNSHRKSRNTSGSLRTLSPRRPLKREKMGYQERFGEAWRKKPVGWGGERPLIQGWICRLDSGDNVAGSNRRESRPPQTFAGGNNEAIETIFGNSA